MKTNPTGPYNPASTEHDDLRMPIKVMEPRPDWNLLGPYICKRWRDALSRINDRLVLQYFPSGHLSLPDGRVVIGFWAVCQRLRRTRLLYKQTVIHLHDPLTGEFRQPSWKTLDMLRREWWRQKHVGMEAIYDEIDAELAKDEELAEKKHMERLRQSVDKSIAALNPSLRLPRIVVPALN